MTWQNPTQAAPASAPAPYNPASQGLPGLWLRLEPGQSIDVTILSDMPVQRLLHWVGDHSEPCTGNLCPSCRAGSRPKARYSVEVMASIGNRTWEMPSRTWQDLSAIAQAVGRLKGLQLRVTRQGAGRDTRYILIPAAALANAPAQPDPQGQAQYLKDLCTANGLDAKAELAAWQQSDGAALANAPAKNQLDAFTAWLEAKVEQMKPAPAPEPAPANIEALF